MQENCCLSLSVWDALHYVVKSIARASECGPLIHNIGKTTVFGAANIVCAHRIIPTFICTKTLQEYRNTNLMSAYLFIKPINIALLLKVMLVILFVQQQVTVALPKPIQLGRRRLYILI